MALSEVSPKYVKPCLSERVNSTESVWLNASEFGESCLSPKDSQTYPPLIPVYNGQILDIKSEFLHATLSGISIKHYNGKCFQESQDDESQVYHEYDTEMNDFDWFDNKSDKTIRTTETMRQNVPVPSATEKGSSEFSEDLQVEGQPICTLPKINHLTFGMATVKSNNPHCVYLPKLIPCTECKFEYRNSFWNIHRPELCKLTWGQKYVSTAVVIEHLHEHLIHHGPFCQGFHTEEDRLFMLNKELNDYVRLKVLACPRELPPDEPPFDIKYEIQVPEHQINPKCKKNRPKVKIPTKLSERVLQIDDDDVGDDNKGVHRSKEEFCLTIGKHMRRTGDLPCKTISVAEAYITPQVSAQEEEGYEYFYYNWFLQNGEDFGDISGKTSLSSTYSTSESLIPLEQKSNLIEDEFCRAAGKVDFSDLRCNPDF